MKQFTLIILILSSIHAISQQTGSFEIVVSFDEPDYSMTNELAFYVPEDYDSGISYPLIVGFRGGPHTGPDHLRNQLQPLSDSLNAIIMCPESMALWQWGQEDLVKPLFAHAVDTTKALYNIDAEKIYVTGLSFGGRHTIIATMDTDAGPIYPGIRGIIPFGAGTNSENIPNYDENTGIPLCTCIGQDDESFFNISYTLHFNATGNGWTTFFNDIPGVGHSMEFPTFIDEMMECFNFIEDQYITGIQESDLQSIQVFPNPAHGILNIDLSPVSHSIYSIRMIDDKGSTVSSQDRYIDRSQVALDISFLNPGSYTLQVMDTKQSGIDEPLFIRKFIVD